MAKVEFDYDTQKDHEIRLRKVLLHSADAIPDRVTEYLHDFTEPGRWRAREEIRRTFVPLVDHLAAEYVSFALKELIKVSDEDAYSYDFGDLGIKYCPEYFPSTPTQGPFLYLLRSDEAQGLRLIHGLTNTATATWRRRVQVGRDLGSARTPLPLTIRGATGSKELWGDETLYCWHRGTSVGPHTVISALMALEVWMEQQLAKGRDGGELLDSVLAGTESVAVLGVCISVSLAFPNQCLTAALSLIENTRTWRMDAHRFDADRRGTPIIQEPHERRRHAYEQLRERNQCPQRRRGIGDLVVLALFTDDDSVRVAFGRAFDSFGNELPFQYTEERMWPGAEATLRLSVEEWRNRLQRENYHRVPEAGGPWVYQVPPELGSLVEPLRPLASPEVAAWMSLCLWASATLDTDELPETAILERTMRMVREAHPAGHPTEQPAGDPDQDASREWAIPGVAAAVACRAWAWARGHGHNGWCRSVLLAAAQSSRHRDLAARGLTALVSHDAGDEESRKAVLGLAGQLDLDVVRWVFSGLRVAWDKDPVLYWNCVSLALSLAVVRRNLVVPEQSLAFNEKGTAWACDLWDRHVANLASGKEPPLLSKVSGLSYFDWSRMVRVLQELPIVELVGNLGARDQLLGVVDALLVWTVAENRRIKEKEGAGYETPPWQWNNFFTGWLARLTRHLTLADVEKHIFFPVLAEWDNVPDLTAGLLRGCLEHHLASLDPLDAGAVRMWERVCRGVLAMPGLERQADRKHLSSDCSESLTLIVFVAHGSYWFKDIWPHAGMFESLVGEWVGILGTNQTAFATLLTMLKGTGSRFPVSTVINWLHQASSKSKDVTALWKTFDNGQRTAEVLHSAWERSRPQLRADTLAFGQFSGLIDRLAAHGAILASVIQKQLEDSDRE